jgi:non-ribosomal peptide synthetase component E (peptide arylation enzyme)
MALYGSPHAALDIPVAPLADFVLARARERGDRAALIEGATGRVITYAQLPELVDRGAASLSRLGVRQELMAFVAQP